MRLTDIKSALFKNALRTAAIMLAFAFIGTLLLATVFDVTRAPIEASEKAARLSLFKEILPAENYDNDLLASQVTIAPNALLGNRLPKPPASSLKPSPTTATAATSSCLSPYAPMVPSAACGF
jgi:Na+-translocating ferredoxin:NAD+ oxidoreductase RnfG subunit